MASPFSVFRKRQKLMLAILGVLAMLAFVVIPSVMQSGGQRPEGANPEVASTKYGVLRRSDIENLLHDQALARSFVANLAEAAENRFIAFQMEQRWGPGRDERVAVRTMLLAKEAEALGMKVSDLEVLEFVRQLSDDTVTGDQLAQIFNSFRVPQSHVLDALRRELLAERLRTMFIGGFVSGQDLIATPAEQWEYFQRLNGSIQAEVAALPVKNFIDQAPEPTEEQLQEYFAKYESDTPGYLVPEPGFRVPTKAAFGYLKADFDKAVAAAVVTDEEVAAHYEENREMYRNPQMPFPDEGLDGGSTLPDFRLPTPPPPSGDEETEETAEPPVDEDAEETDASQEPADEVPTDEVPTDDEPAGEEPAGEEPADEEPDAVPGDCQPADESADDEVEPIESEADEEVPADAEENSVEAISDEAASAEGTTEDEAPADDLPIREDGGLPGLAADDLPVREDLVGRPERPVYKPLSEVAEQIRRTLKNRQAAESVQAAVDAVMAVRNQYYQDYLLAKANEQDPPAAPDMKALAAAHHMTVHETGLLSQQEIFEEGDIGKSFYLPRGANQQTMFTQFAYDNLQPFQPGNSQDGDGSRYVYWQTEKVLEHATDLKDEETRRHVVRTWKLEQARDIARKRAEELAEAARQSGGTLKDALAEESLEVVETGEFTWMNDLFGQGQPRLSEVHGVEHAGHDFMRTVFALGAGEVGVAANQPQDTVYLVRVARLTQSPEVLRAIFKATPFRSYSQVAAEEYVEVNRHWIEQIEQQAELIWLETPDDRIASR